MLQISRIVFPEPIFDTKCLDKRSLTQVDDIGGYAVNKSVIILVRRSHVHPYYTSIARKISFRCICR